MNSKRNTILIQLGLLFLLTVLIVFQGTLNNDILDYERTALKPFALGIILAICVAELLQLKLYYGLSFGDLARSFCTYAFILGTCQIFAGHLFPLDLIYIECVIFTCVGIFLSLGGIIYEKRMGFALLSIAMIMTPWLIFIASIYWYYGGQRLIMGLIS